jgi:hypothetical protein
MPENSSLEPQVIPIDGTAATPGANKSTETMDKVKEQEANATHTLTKHISRPRDRDSNWESVIPWFLTVACTVSLVSIALFLILNVEWFKASVFDQVTVTNAYKIYVYHMHLSMIKRSVGLFSGFAMMFVGASVCTELLTKLDYGVARNNCHDFGCYPNHVHYME